MGDPTSQIQLQNYTKVNFLAKLSGQRAMSKDSSDIDKNCLSKTSLFCGGIQIGMQTMPQAGSATLFIFCQAGGFQIHYLPPS